MCDEYQLLDTVCKPYPLARVVNHTKKYWVGLMKSYED